MADLNIVSMIGNLTGDPEVKTFDGGKIKTKFSIAVSGWKKDKTTFWNCTAWGQVGEFVGEYLKKGNKVAISGEMDCDEYEKNGEKKYWVFINCRSVQNLTPKPKGDKDQQTQEEDNIDVPF